MNFERDTKYTRREVYKIATGKEKMPFDFQQTGYGTVDNNVFAFINIVIKVTQIEFFQTNTTKILKY